MNLIWSSIIMVFLMAPWALAQDSGVLISSSQQESSSNNLIGDPLDTSGNENSNGSEHHRHSHSDSDSQVSDSDDIISKSVNVIMQEITANMKLTPDQINQVQLIVTENVTKVRDLQLSVEDGKIDSKTMVDQRQQLMNDENQRLSQIFSPDQMRAWVNIQSN